MNNETNSFVLPYNKCKIYITHMLFCLYPLNWLYITRYEVYFHIEVQNIFFSKDI